MEKNGEMSDLSIHTCGEHKNSNTQDHFQRLPSSSSHTAPIPSQPTAPAVGFYLSCVQDQASVKGAEGSVGASALSSGRKTRASITCNIELLGHFCASDQKQMDGETKRGMLSSNTLAHPSHLPLEGVLRIEQNVDSDSQGKIWLNPFQRCKVQFPETVGEKHISFKPVLPKKSKNDKVHSKWWRCILNLT